MKHTAYTLVAVHCPTCGAEANIPAAAAPSAFCPCCLLRESRVVVMTCVQTDERAAKRGRKVGHNRKERAG